jgi:hypothetical protein
MLSYGATGAMIGSAIPVVGTAIGAGVGAGVGAAVANWDKVSAAGSAVGHGISSAWNWATGGGAKPVQRGLTGDLSAAGITGASVSSPGPAGLGGLSAQFESNGRPDSVGRDSTGGPSYGTYQIATKTGTFDKFMGWLQGSNPAAAKALQEAGGAAGAKAGTPQFVAAWKGLARDAGFAQSQHDFIKSTHFDPLVQKLAGKGLDVTKRSKGLQDVIWSTAVQHGGGTDVVESALAKIGKPPEKVTDAELTSAIYAERRGRFGSSTKAVQASVMNRFNDEERLAQVSIRSDPGPVGGVDKTPGGSAAIASGGPQSVSAGSPDTASITAGRALMKPSDFGPSPAGGASSGPSPAGGASSGAPYPAQLGSLSAAGIAPPGGGAAGSLPTGSVGSGQCVALVQKACNVGHTSTWSAGDPVLGNSGIQPGTPIATFDQDGKYGNHTDGTSHAAIYMGPSTTKPGGIQVYDQWKGHAASVRDIGLSGDPANNAKFFRTIKGGAAAGAGITAGGGPSSVQGTAISQSLASTPPGGDDAAPSGAPSSISTPQPGGGGIEGLLRDMLTELRAISGNTGKMAGAADAASQGGGAGGGRDGSGVTQNVFSLPGGPKPAAPGASAAMSRLVAGA